MFTLITHAYLIIIHLHIKICNNVKKVYEKALKCGRNQYKNNKFPLAIFMLRKTKVVKNNKNSLKNRIKYSKIIIKATNLI